MKLRTREQLLDAIDSDLSWRRKEIAVVNFLIRRHKLRPQALNTALRAGIALLYAHWEGFLKNSSDYYLEFVSYQRLSNEHLADNFLAISARKPLKDTLASGKISQCVPIVQFFRTKMSEQSDLPLGRFIQTESNLSSSVLKEIAITLGLDYSQFETKAMLIDERLVQKRNTVAHGQFLDLDADDFNEVYSEVTGMLDAWRTQIENACVTRRYQIGM